MCCNLVKFEEFFFINDEKLVKLSYLTALAHCFWDSYDNFVPLNKLAHIGAYFCLLQIINELQENVNTILAEQRSYLNEKKLRESGSGKAKREISIRFSLLINERKNNNNKKK